MDVPTTSLNAFNVGLHGGQLLEKISPVDSRKSDGVFKINFHRNAFQTVASQNGFIWAAAEIYDRNTGLNIRVDNIWLAILAQLKPYIYQAVRPQAKQDILTFTRAELNNPDLVAKRLSDMVEARIGPQVTNVLMPHFSTTMHTDSGAAALILLGTHCKAQPHRIFMKPKKTYDRKTMVVVGDTADWEKLRQSFATIRTWSPDLEAMVSRHSSLLDKMLGAGYQFDHPSEFWDGMLKVDHDGRLSGGWILDFFDPRKINQPEGFTFNDDMTSAVTTIPIRVGHSQDIRNCTIVGGLLGHSRERSGVLDQETRGELGIVQPMSGWLVYFNKNL
ncbi:hypothetical protein FOXYS1_7384 [Fusarium oxysporum]|uniref:Uncharacterized protein n=1 Tax=Fusarium oxysporum TaxID=5507 RepID=A0A8H5EIH3_FUSOX|nr:hypothetical protein FOXYS1_7384 [Fusarium oxysporum]